MSGAAPFNHLTKDVEIQAISMRDIEHQLSKSEKPVPDPSFLDVFSKEAPNTIFHLKRTNEESSSYRYLSRYNGVPV